MTINHDYSFAKARAVIHVDKAGDNRAEEAGPLPGRDPMINGWLVTGSGWAVLNVRLWVMATRLPASGIGGMGHQDIAARALSAHRARMAKLLFSYSHKDEDLRNELETHLATLKREGLIEAFHNRRISAGAHLDDAIDAYLEEADVILCLVNPDFIDSEYCYSREMTRVLERDAVGEAKIIPVIVRHCDWPNTPLAKLRGKPRGRAALRHIRRGVDNPADRNLKSGAGRILAPRRARRMDDWKHIGGHGLANRLTLSSAEG